MILKAIIEKGINMIDLNNDVERQVFQTDILTGLVGHEHHCYICGDITDLFYVNKSGILCRDCIRIQKEKYGTVFTSVEPYKIPQV